MMIESRKLDKCHDIAGEIDDRVPWVDKIQELLQLKKGTITESATEKQATQ